MEDDNELELSLGLSCGGSSIKSKVNDVTSGGIQKNDGKQKGDPVSRPHETFLTGLGKRSTYAADESNVGQQNSLSQFSGYQDMWISNNKTTDTKEEQLVPKRKFSFEEINFQNKHEKVVDSHGKVPEVTSLRTSHVSVTTEDGSFGENEEVAESEPNGAGSQVQKKPRVFVNESKSEIGKSTYGVPLSLKPLTTLTVPYVVPAKAPTAATVPNATGFPSPCFMQPTPFEKNERPLNQSTNTNNQLVFGYSPVQLPTLETNLSWEFTSHPRHLSSFASAERANGVPNTEHFENDAKLPQGNVPQNSTSALVCEGNSLNLVRGGGKHVGEVGTSSSFPITDELNGTYTIYRPREVANRTVMEGFPHEGSIIRPGISSNVSFGGCGSCPDLPWVSTTGPGPNGNTISGVPYVYSKNQIKIVCACHGSHMSVEEFVQHASADAPNPEKNSNTETVAGINQTASAQAK